MALRPLNSAGGISVGESPIVVILANGDITTANAVFTGNVSANAVLTDNYFYANGAPLDLQNPSGSNNQIQFNDNTDFGASANLTFDPATNLFTVVGNVSASNANLGNLVTANFFSGDGSLLSNVTANPGNLIVSGNSNVAVSANSNVTISVSGNANIATFTGTGANVSGTLYVSGNVTANAQIVSNVTTGTAPFVINSTTEVANLYAANATYANSANTANTAITVTGNAQANITSVGTLTGLVVGNATANTTFGNGTIVATGNITSQEYVITDNIKGNATSITISSAGANTNVILAPTGTGTVDVSSKRITSLLTPDQPTDAATKAYVDAIASSLSIHQAVDAATIAGFTVTYNNGTLGVGATLTNAGTQAALTVDGYTPTVGDRILVKNQATLMQNGIYEVTDVGSGSTNWILTRTTDFDNSPVTELHAGIFVFVTNGSQAASGWVETAIGTGVPGDYLDIGTDDIEFTQFSSAGAYTNGPGLNLVGFEFSIANTTVTANSYGNATHVPTFTVNSRGQLTYATETIVVAPAGTLTGTTLNANIVTSSLTTVGTLGNLTVTGNVTAGNIIGVYANGTSNINIPAIDGNINLSASGNANILVVTGTGANVDGTLAVTGKSNLNAISNVFISGGTDGQVIKTDGAGNLSFVTISTGSISNGTSNVDIATSGGNVGISAAGNANVLVVSGTGANITGTLNVSGNTTLGNVIIGNSSIRSTTVTTVGITANQALATVSSTGTRGIVFEVKGEEAAGGKYSLATVSALHNGTLVDYAIYGTLMLGTTTGSLSVAYSSGNVILQVTPASSNSTVWTTQYRTV